jgi:hypothetical protein
LCAGSVSQKRCRISLLSCAAMLSVRATVLASYTRPYQFQPRTGPASVSVSIAWKATFRLLRAAAVPACSVVAAAARCRLWYAVLLLTFTRSFGGCSLLWALVDNRIPPPSGNWYTE